MPQGAYLIITGAGSASEVAPPLIEGLAARFPTVLILLTPNAGRVVNARDLSLLSQRLTADPRAGGSHGTVRIVEGYFDPAILPRPPRGLVLVAPCTFNSLNALAHGLSPTLPLAVANEAIGRRTPVVVAVACNADLWAHPQAPASAERLRAWGCTVLDPAPAGAAGGLGLAPPATILAAVDAARRAAPGGEPSGRE